MATTLKDFLVSIGYKIDGGSEKKFNESIRNATLQAALLARGIEEAVRAVAKAITSITSNFEVLFYQAQRTTSSVAGIKSLTYALTQVGVSSGAAAAAVAEFSRKLTIDPGQESLLKYIGVQTRDAKGNMLDATRAMEQLGKVFQRLPLNVANQYAQVLGLDYETMRALRDQPDHLRKFREESERTAKIFGLNQDEAAKKSVAFMNSLRSLGNTISTLAEKIFTDLAPSLQLFIEKIQKWIEQNPDKIRETIEGIAKGVYEFAKSCTELATALQPVIDKIAEWAKSITGSENGLQAALTVFAAWLVGTWVVRILSAFALVGGGWAAMLLRLGIPLAIGGAAIGHGFQTPEQAAKDPDQARLQKEGIDRRQRVRDHIGGLWERGKRAIGLGGRSEGDGGGTGDYSGQAGHQRTMTGATFQEKAPKIMAQLMKDFNLSKEEAGIILGNLGHESAGFRAFEERRAGGGTGPGRGWAQWTDPGRKARFFKFASDNKLDPRSDEANYGFLRWELKNTHRSSISALKNAQSIQEKMVAFENRYEGASIKGWGSRWRYYNAAIGAYDRAGAADKVPYSDGPTPDQAAKAAASVNKAPDGAGKPATAAPPLGSTSNDNRSTSVSQTNTATIHVQTSDAADAANRVLQGQRSIATFGLRGIQTAVR